MSAESTHAGGFAGTRSPRGGDAIRRVARAGWPVLAVLALCPLVATLSPTEPASVLARAAALTGFERSLGLHVEPAAVAWLAARPLLLEVAQVFYFWLHLPVTVGVLVWTWLERRAAFAAARDAFVGAQVLTVASNLLLPTAPPWMSPAAAVLAAAAHAVYPLQSPFEAMPSGHVAFAAVAAGIVVALVRNRAVRAAAVAYAMLVAAVVVGTGNHYLVDVATGAAVAAPASCVAVLRRRRA